MAVDRFAALKHSGVKVAEVSQGLHIRQLRQPAPGLPDAGLKFSHENYRHLEHGICAGLTVNWLREKLTLSNSVFRPSPKQFVHSPSPGRLEQIMHAGAVQQLSHGRDGVRLSELLGTHGIDTAQLTVKQGMDANLAPFPLIDKGFEQACAAMRRGDGMLMVTSVHENGGRIGGHATAMYKSHGDKVYFFDPNAGAYHVDKPAQFVQAWIASFATRHRTVAMDSGTGDGFFTCTLHKAANAAD